MAWLHYFYPGNDLALAADLEGFTPPKAAVVLGRAGSSLPLWYGEPGDRVIDNGIDARWFERAILDFKLETDVFGGDPDSYQAAPWGWSKASRRVFLDFGMSAKLLPDDAQLARMRLLSHRRTAALLATHLRSIYGAIFAEPALEVNDEAEIERLLNCGRRMMVKIPWSSSGRGVIDTASASVDDLKRRILGTVARQGSVMFEPFIADAVDFALLYDYRNGNASFKGLSVFRHDAHFGYAGNMVADEDSLEKTLEAQRIMLPDNLRENTALFLKQIIGGDYTGPLGVDFVSNGSVMAVAEINLRMTMGHVAHRLARLLAPGVKALYSISPNKPIAYNPAIQTYKAQNGRLSAGTMQLVPPSAELAFSLSVIK